MQFFMYLIVIYVFLYIYTFSVIPLNQLDEILKNCNHVKELNYYVLADFFKHVFLFI